MSHDTQASTGELITRVTEQTKQLVRDEVRLAQAETSEKVAHGVKGIAGFGVAGLLALYGVAGVLVTIGLALAEAMPGWLASLVVTVVVLAGAGAAALLGKREVGAVGPVPPEHAIEGVKQDVATLKGQEV